MIAVSYADTWMYPSGVTKSFYISMLGFGIEALSVVTLQTLGSIWDV